MVRKISKKNGETKPSFCRFLFEGHSTQHLPVPRDFLKHMMKDLSDTAILKLKHCSASSWTVKVSKTSKGAVYFKQGWQKFLRDNSLDNNEFLVFHYDGKMHFTVQIFDKRGVDRDDFRKRSHRNSSTLNTAKRPRGRPRKQPANSSKIPRPLNSCKDDSVEILSSSESGEVQEIKEEEVDCEDSTSEDWEVAEPEPFKSKFHHLKCINTSKYNLYITKAFSRKHFPQGTFHLNLENVEGKNWTVKAIANRGSHFLTTGWNAFTSANKISIGDTLIFELLSENTMMVHTFEKESV